MLTPADADAAAPRMPRRVELFAVAILMVTFLALGWASTSRMSLTADESAHIPAGLALWQRRDTRLNPEHPPLLKLIAAAPLAAFYRQDYSSPLFSGAGVKTEFAFANLFWSGLPHSDVQHVVLMARFPMLLLLAGTALLVYAAARRISGAMGALLSLGLFITSPFFLGYGPLVITDFGVVFFALATLLAFSRLLRQPGWRAIGRLSFYLSAALLSKFMALLLPPALVIAHWLYRPGPKAHRRPRFALATAFGMCSAIIYAVYWAACGRSWAPTLMEQRMADARVTFDAGSSALAVKRMAAVLGAHPHLAAPVNPLMLYLTGVLQTALSLGRSGYLLGHTYQNGEWYYFPVLYLLRMTPAMHLAALVALLAGFAAWRKRDRQLSSAAQDPALLLAVIVTLAVSSLAAITSSLNIGLRHVALPIALVIILLSRMAPLMARAIGPKAASLAVVGIVGMGMASAMSTFPDYIPYFNGLRGPVPKAMIAADSNTDWAQQLIEVERYRAEHDIPEPYVVMLGIYPPRLYVENARWLECARTPLHPGDWGFIGANAISLNPACRALQQWQTDVIAGGSMYVFHIPEARPPQTRR